jgi:hypothetical protein
LTDSDGLEHLVNMTPLQALRCLEVAAARIDEGPQTDQSVRDALNTLRGRVTRWKLDWLWDHLQVDVRTAHSALIGASQNANAALNGIALDLKQERLGPVATATAVRASRDKAGASR